LFLLFLGTKVILELESPIERWVVGEMVVELWVVGEVVVVELWMVANPELEPN
jgi:hypothetical protein